MGDPKKLSDCLLTIDGPRDLHSYALPDGDDLQLAIEALEAENARMREALKALVDRLDYVHDHRAYHAVWVSYSVHGGNYAGPKYKDELDAARAALSPTADKPAGAEESDLCAKCGCAKDWHDLHDSPGNSKPCNYEDMAGEHSCDCAGYTKGSGVAGSPQPASAGRTSTPEPASHCPDCESPRPEQHPAVQFEGEVDLCRNPWHASTEAGRSVLASASPCNHIAACALCGWRHGRDGVWRKPSSTTALDGSEPASPAAPGPLSDDLVLLLRAKRTRKMMAAAASAGGRFVMSVPARPDDDLDLLVCDFMDNVVPRLLSERDAAVARAEKAEKELETERMRLAACGVVALADTPESAANARRMHPDYWSASCYDVARRVDECIALRAQLAAKTQEALNTGARLHLLTHGRGDA